MRIMALTTHSMNKEFAGKVAIVTGAARGIGRAVCRHLGQRGASILMGDILSDVGELAARTLSSQGITARFMRMDTRTEWDVQRFISYAAQLYGRVDIVVACAGVLHVAPATEVTPEQFHSIFDVNVLGTSLLIKHAIPQLVQSGGGSIIILSSISGELGFPELSLYCASKAALSGLTRSLAVELAKKNIRVNSLMPSMVDTDMVEEEMNAREQLGQGAGDVVLERCLSSQPIARMATVDEVAEAVCFLASPHNPLLTGVNLPLDGGLRCV